jgi:hypothetical protein
VQESPALSAVNLAWWFWLAATGMGVMLAVAHGVLGGARVTETGTPPPRDALFLGWWFAVALVFGAAVAPFLAMRRVVEASLPAWLLVLRPNGSHRVVARVTCAVTLMLNTALGFAVAAADYSFAGVYPRFAAHLAQLGVVHGGRIWCYGYWGWSHYTAALGFPRYVRGRAEPPPGSLLVIPDEVAKPADMPESLRRRLRLAYNQPVSGRIPLRLMSFQAGAGYYSAGWGPLPYAWSRLPFEEFHFWQVE